MKISKQAQNDAKRLFQSCFVKGALSERKVKQVVRKLIQLKPRGYLQILNRFARLVKLDVSRRATLVESAFALEEAQKNRLKKTLEAQHGGGLDITFSINKDLIAGIRIQVGSDVFDSSVQSRLSELENSF